MTEPFVGQVQAFSYKRSVRGWAPCDGGILQVLQNQALFSLVGAIYGGDGRTTFALPDLRAATPVHPYGGLSGRIPAQQIAGKTNGGATSVTLQPANVPSHTHAVVATTASANNTNPSGGVPATPSFATYSAWPATDAAAQTTLPAGTIEVAGGGVPHGNMQPYLTVYFMIAVSGFYPTRD